MEQTIIDPITILEDRIGQCIELSISAEKYPKAKELINRSVKDLLKIDFKTSDQVVKNFNHFVNKALSTVEILGLNEMQYKATRKLILAEIYACRDYVLDGLKSISKVK